MHNKAKPYVFIFFLALTAVLIQACSPEPGENKVSREKQKTIRLGILPFTGIGEADVAVVKSAVETYYGFEVTVLAKRPIPKAYFTTLKSPRYRADSILKYLRSEQLDNTQLLLGLTNQDISTTKYGRDGKIKEPRYKYEDWGIFGLGSVGGGVCVVSNHRLGRKVGPIRKTERLKKVALHEVGHALGLPHCPQEECFMRDAAEKMSTVDQVKMALCQSCKDKIGLN